MKVTTEIAEIIKKNLPAQVGEELQKELVELGRLRNVTKTDKQCINKYIEESLKDKQEIRELTKELKDHDDIDLRVKKIVQRENQAEIESLKVLLAAETSKNNHSMAVAMGLVRNTEYRKSMNGTQVAMSNMADGGSFATTQPINKNETEGAD